MSMLGSIDVALRGDTSHLDHALDRSQMKVKEFEARTQGGSSGNMLGGLTAAFVAVTAAVTVAVLAFNKFAEVSESIEAVARTARQLGITTSALGGLQHGAAMAGVPLETLTMGLERFQKHLSAASQGNIEINASLARMGLQVEDLKDLPLEIAVGRWGDALKRVGNDADQVNETITVFGRNAGSLKEFLKTGGEGISQAFDEARKLGFSLTDDESKDIQSMVKEWREFDQALRGIGRSLARIFAPLLAAGDSLTAKIATWISQNVKFFQELVSFGADVVKTYFQIWYTINGLGAAFGFISDALGTNGDSWQVWQQMILRVVWTAQFFMMNWRTVVGGVFDELALAGVRFGNTIESVFSAIGRAGERVWAALRRGDFRGIGTAITDAFNEVRDRPRTENEMARQDRINASRNVFRDGLEGFLQFNFNRFQQLGRPDQRPGGPNENDAIVAKKPAAMEMGSKEAFSVLYGTQSQQEKALHVANDQLRAARQQLEELRALRRQRQQALRRAPL